MSENIYDWSAAEIQAALEAYQAAPESATVGELREAMISARDSVRAEAEAPVVTDYSREELVAICEAGVVAHEDWCDRDTARAQAELVEAAARLQFVQNLKKASR